MISSAAHPRWIRFPSNIEDKRLGWLIRFFCGLLGVTRGRFLSMINSAAHPRWPPQPVLTGPNFGASLGEGSFRWPALIQHGRYGSHLGFGFCQLSDGTPVSTGPDFFVAYWGSSIFTIFHFSLNFIFHIPTDNFPLWGICHALCSPCLLLAVSSVKLDDIFWNKFEEPLLIWTTIVEIFFHPHLSFLYALCQKWDHVISHMIFTP
jgi:hypothetical protein